MKKLKGIDGKLDTAWAKLVKLRAGMKCEVCGKTSPLNSHHIYSRSKRSVRWNPENGVCLCVGHHTFRSDFSAHLTPTEFTIWLYENKGKKYMNDLRIKGNSISKLTIFEKEISARSYAKIQEKLFKYPGFFVQTRTLRTYPEQSAAHLLGYVGEASPKVIEKNNYYKSNKPILRRKQG